MELAGAIFATLDCEPGYLEAWHRWYDLDHLPESVSLGPVIDGRRYVATPGLAAARLVPGAGDDGPFAPGRSTFLTVYTLHDVGDACRAAMDEAQARLSAAGRTAPPDRTSLRWIDALHLGWTYAAPDVAVRAEAVPYLAHTGVVLVVGEAAPGADAAEAAAWARDVHLPALVSVPGVLAGLRFDNVAEPVANRTRWVWETDPTLERTGGETPAHARAFVHLLLLDEPAEDVARALVDGRGELERAGALRPPPGLATIALAGTFARWSPLGGGAG